MALTLEKNGTTARHPGVLLAGQNRQERF